MTAELQGFSAAKQTGIRLSVDQVARIDLTLADGGADRGRRGAGGHGRARHRDRHRRPGHHREADHGPAAQRAELPVAAVPGRGRGRDRRASRARMRQGVGNAISLMGARPTSNNFMIDGTANIDTALGTPAAILSVDAMEEFKEQTKTYSAEYGFSANQINLVSKSGTQRVPRLALLLRPERGARRQELLRPRRPREKPELDQKQFGGTISGPIIKNKTFLLVNYEGTRIERGSSPSSSCPPPDQLAGRFTTHDHRSRSPASPSRTTRSRRRASRASPSWRSGTGGTPPRTPTRRRATTSTSGRFPRRRTSSPSASTRTWAGSEGRSPASRRRRTRTRPAGR